MKDRNKEYPNRYELKDIVTGQIVATYDLVRAEGGGEDGTPLNKTTLLEDNVADSLGLTPATATPSDAFKELAKLSKTIVETGSLNGWTWEKRADGMAFATLRRNIGTVTCLNALGNMYASNSISVAFPFTFVEIPICILKHESNDTGYAFDYSTGPATEATTTTKSHSIRLARIASASIALNGVVIVCTVQGRWK